MYDLDNSLYDDNDDGSIAAFPEGTMDKRGLAYSQWRKNGKRSQVRISGLKHTFISAESFMRKMIRKG